MPNHCFNSLIISGTALPVILDKYIRKDDNGGYLFDFEKIIPIGETDDWYEQRIEKWGTKWIGYDVSTGGSAIDFYTAWSPPIPILKKLAELHKDHIFVLEYYEPGMAFRGRATAEWQDDGVLLEDSCWNMTEEDFKELGFHTEAKDHENPA
jgi:hypothetical protein